KTAYFWDLGVSITYPGNWVDPLYIAGQMTLGPTTEAVQGQSSRQPVIAFRILDATRELNMPKSATLPQIDAALSGDNGVNLSKPQGTYIAGLDAASLDLDDT